MNQNTPYLCSFVGDGLRLRVDDGDFFCGNFAFEGAGHVGDGDRLRLHQRRLRTGFKHPVKNTPASPGGTALPANRSETDLIKAARAAGPARGSGLYGCVTQHRRQRAPNGQKRPPERPKPRPASPGRCVTAPPRNRLRSL